MKIVLDDKKIDLLFKIIAFAALNSAGKFSDLCRDLYNEFKKEVENGDGT